MHRLNEHVIAPWWRWTLVRPAAARPVRPAEDARKPDDPVADVGQLDDLLREAGELDLRDPAAVARLRARAVRIIDALVDRGVVPAYLRVTAGEPGVVLVRGIAVAARHASSPQRSSGIRVG